MRKLHFSALGVGLLSLACLNSCVDDSYDLDNMSDDIYIPIEQVVPIGHSVINAGDLLKEVEIDGLHSAEDGLIYFQYDTITRIDLNPFRFSLDEHSSKHLLSELLDVDRFNEFKVLQYIPSVDLSAGAELPIVFDDESGEGEIDTIVINHADVDFKINSNIPGINDKMMLIVDTRDYPGCDYTWDNVHKKGTVTFNNSKLDLTKSQTIPFKCTIKITDNVPFELQEDSYIEIVTNLNWMRYDRICGFMKAKETQIETNSLSIDLFNEEDMSYNIKFTDPHLRINITSNAGVPIDASIEELKARKIDGSSVDGLFNGNKKYPLHLSASNVVGKEVLALKEEFDAQNCNVADLLNSSPDTLDVTNGFLINGPKLSADQKPYFILDSTYVNLGLTAYIPFWLNKGSNIIQRDTLDEELFDALVDYEESDFEVDSAIIYLEVNNKMPLKVNVVATFLEDDSLASNYADSIYVYKEIKNPKLRKTIDVKAAPVLPQTHKVYAPQSSRVAIYADKSMVKDLKRTKKILLTYTIDVPDSSESVILNTYNTIEAKGYVSIKGAVDTEKDNK